MTQVPVRLACKALLASLARPPSSATWRVERHFGAVLVRSQDQVLIRPVSGRVGPCRRLLRRRPLLLLVWRRRLRALLLLLRARLLCTRLLRSRRLLPAG